MANTYKLIASSTVGAGGTSAIEFTFIPQTYTDLIVKLSLRDSNNTGTMFLKFNGSSTGYSAKGLYGTGASALSENLTNASIQANPSGYTASTFGNQEIYIPNYTGSNYKSYSIDSVTENNATTAYMELFAYLWSNTAAITSFSITQAAGNIAQYSTAYLYGIKNS